MHGRRNLLAKILIINHKDGYRLGTVGSLNIQSDFIRGSFGSNPG
jgi:hypothetical protein